jgi:hypothetical protein
MPPALHHAIMSGSSEQGAFPTIVYCTLETGPMKALTVTAILLASGAVALAKPNPDEEPRLALANADINMGSVGAMRESIGSVRAMRERDYFEAPQSPFNAGSFPCRLEPDVFAKTRLAQSCR